MQRRLILFPSSRCPAHGGMSGEPDGDTRQDAEREQQRNAGNDVGRTVGKCRQHNDRDDDRQS